MGAYNAVDIKYRLPLIFPRFSFFDVTNVALEVCEQTCHYFGVLMTQLKSVCATAVTMFSALSGVDYHIEQSPDAT